MSNEVKCVARLDDYQALVAERDKLAASHAELREALGLLMHEVEEAGLAGAKDYGWPRAVLATRLALTRAKAVGESV